MGGKMSKTLFGTLFVIAVIVLLYSKRDAIRNKLSGPKTLVGKVTKVFVTHDNKWNWGFYVLIVLIVVGMCAPVYIYYIHTPAEAIPEPVDAYDIENQQLPVPETP